ncbi:putative disease resistance protein RGA4 [Pistacia vera]|uniref:putative disease resistance protein RGA4 n=1 Tax=Pistacia vera TaxID=55513 RepID=UPI001263866D|nr:putative disease resistance protein RGA4 [Pistacia vera]
MAESILFDIATEVMMKIGYLVGRELSLLWNLESSLKSLAGTLGTIRVVLSGAEKKQAEDDQLCDWLGKLKDVLLDAEDILEKFYHKIKEIRERLDQIAGDRSKFSLIESTPVEVRHEIPKDRETDPFLGASCAIGREDDKENIMSFLMQPTDINVSVIPIVGIGGLGKTTLTKMVYNDERSHKWIDLKDLLVNGVNGSKIIVSTRSKRVAEIMSTGPSYFLQGLSNEESLSLFKKYAFKDGEGKDFPRLIDIAKDIVGKCKGVPLAVKSLGSLLYANTDECEWLKIKQNDIWQVDQDNEDILPVLKFSYDQLPSPLKRCFTYLCLFPKDSEYLSSLVA